MNSDDVGSKRWEVRLITHVMRAGTMGSWLADIRMLGGKPIHKVLGATKEKTSAEQLELRGVIEAIKFIRSRDSDPGTIAIWTSSNYVKRIMTEWYKVWVANGWTLANGHAPRNSERIKELWTLCEGLNIKWLNLEDGDHLEVSELDSDLRDDQ